MAATDTRRELLGLGRAPSAGLVIMHGRHQPQDGLNDRPRGLHAALTREKGAVADYGVAQETLVGVHLIPVWAVDHFEFRRIANQLLAGALHTGTDSNRHAGAQPEAHIVRRAWTQFA